MAHAVPHIPTEFKIETPDAREARLAWERARLAEADADYAAGRYIEGDEAEAWLKQELTDARVAMEREAD
jgi:predicted transcriptional regulator